MTRLKRMFLATTTAAAALLTAGCPTTTHKIDTTSTIEVKPIEIKPIYARIDVYIKIDKELDSFFDFEKTLQPKDPKKATDASNGKAGAL